MQTVIITGGTGMIGKALTTMLTQQGYKVIILTREVKPSDNPLVSFAHWDIEKQSIDTNAIAEADYIIHLAGGNVAEKRWTTKRKKEILESRTKSGALLVKALTDNKHHVKALISASAIGWYGPDNAASIKDGFKEDAQAHNDFLGSTCLQWEASTQQLSNKGIRTVYLRTGIVLSNEGGAFKEFKNPLRFGVAAVLGSGKQVISWIHIEDMCRMYLYALQHEMNGSFNAVAPKPVTNKEFTLQLAKAEKGKAFIPVHVPSFVLRLMLGEMSIEVLKSCTVNADKIRQEGFKFLYPSLDAALNELLSK